MTKRYPDLEHFLAQHRDSREYKRGLAVHLALSGYLYEVICDMLALSPEYISQWKNHTKNKVLKDWSSNREARLVICNQKNVLPSLYGSMSKQPGVGKSGCFICR